MICGNACSISNAVATCESGSCAFDKCNSGYGDCDNNLTNGCETALNTVDNCGVCGVKCTGTQYFCLGGKCTGIKCLEGKADCNQDYDRDGGNGCEADLTSIATCGTCNNKCEALEGQSVSCVSGLCQVDSCPTAGTYDCNKNSQDGCESTLKDNLNCGACGSVCKLDNATSSCASGKCEIVSCNAPFGDCDKDAGNGCERALNSADNCGKCDNVCPATGKHMTASGCVSGVCQAAACDANWGDCNNNASDGCETDLASSQANCGKCGNACGGLRSKCCSGSCEVSWAC
jgi:hypothetical protein